MLLPDTLPTDKKPKVTVLTRKEFDELLDYSCSLPTGTTIGKRWKRNNNAYRRPLCSHLHVFDGTREPDFQGPDWWMGEYALDPEAKMGRDGKPETVLILWSKIVVV